MLPHESPHVYKLTFFSCQTSWRQDQGPGRCPSLHLTSLSLLNRSGEKQPKNLISPVTHKKQNNKWKFSIWKINICMCISLFVWVHSVVHISILRFIIIPLFPFFSIFLIWKIWMAKPGQSIHQIKTLFGKSIVYTKVIKSCS